MLTISRDRHLSLAVNRRDTFWNKTSILALTLAIAFHAAGFFLFKVKTVTCRQSQVILEPISVAMEMPVLIEQQILVDDTYVRIPPRPKVAPTPPMTKPHTHLPSWSFSFAPPPAQISSSSLELPPSVTVTLLGALEGREFIDAPDEIEHLPHTKGAHYTLTINNHTGEILSISPLDDLAKEMVNWHFNPKEGEILTRGEVEVQVR